MTTVYHNNFYSIFIISWLSVSTNGSQKATTSFLEGKLQIFLPIKLRRDVSFSSTSSQQPSVNFDEISELKPTPLGNKGKFYFITHSQS